MRILGAALLAAFTLALAQPTEALWRVGADLGCSGPLGQGAVRVGAWRLGVEYASCAQTSRLSLVVGNQPLEILPLEANLFAGFLAGFPSVGASFATWVPLGRFENHLQANLVFSAGLSLTALPLGGILPGLRASAAVELRHPLNLPEGVTAALDPAFAQGASCTSPTAESLAETFHRLAQSTKEAVVASLSAVYTDFLVELSGVEVRVEGSSGMVQGSYRVGATHKATGRRYVYAGRGVARFAYDGCSWTLVSYSY